MKMRDLYFTLEDIVSTRKELLAKAKRNKVAKDMIEQEVCEPFDHRNLNLDVADFRDLNPTAENIAYVIWHKLRKRLDARFDLAVRLCETPRNCVEYHGQ